MKAFINRFIILATVLMWEIRADLMWKRIVAELPRETRAWETWMYAKVMRILIKQRGIVEEYQRELKQLFEREKRLNELVSMQAPDVLIQNGLRIIWKVADGVTNELTQD